MPKGSYDKGDLFVQFDIQFPKTKILQKGQIETSLDLVQPPEPITTVTKEEKILEDTEGPIPEQESEDKYQSKYSKKKGNKQGRTQQCAQM